jgi:hypothetical protein
MTDDNEIERRQFMHKPVPAKPKVAGQPPSPPPDELIKQHHQSTNAYDDSGKIVGRMLPGIADQRILSDPFADFATIVKLLRRHNRETRHHILELITELID